MSSRMTMGLASFLIVGAVVAGYWGLTLSKPQSSAPLAEPVLSQPIQAETPTAELDSLLERSMPESRSGVVVLARDLKAPSVLQAEDLVIEQVRIAPPGSFSDINAVLGRTLWRDMPAGSWLADTSFEMAGPLARMIRADERALAIELDEVVGGGGHLQPGDFVDVLLFLREDERNTDRTAQVVVPALRVLSVGPQLGASRHGEPLQAPPADTDQDERRSRRADQPRTAVLAVPEALLTRFMLATQVGTLRLAVRSVDEQLLVAYYAGENATVEVEELKRQLFQFEKLAMRQAARPQAGLVTPRSASVPVYHGNSVARQNP